MPQEIRAVIHGEYLTNVKEKGIIVKCYELISELSKTKAPINKTQETPFDRQISTARQIFEELNENETIHSYHKKDLIPKSKQN